MCIWVARKLVSFHKSTMMLELKNVMHVMKFLFVCVCCVCTRQFSQSKIYNFVYVSLIAMCIALYCVLDVCIVLLFTNFLSHDSLFTCHMHDNPIVKTGVTAMPLHNDLDLIVRL